LAGERDHAFGLVAERLRRLGQGDRFIKAGQMGGDEQVVDVETSAHRPVRAQRLPRFGLTEVGKIASIEHGHSLPGPTDSRAGSDGVLRTATRTVDSESGSIARSVSHAPALPKSGSSSRSSMLRSSHPPPTGRRVRKSTGTRETRAVDSDGGFKQWAQEALRASLMVSDSPASCVDVR